MGCFDLMGDLPIKCKLQLEKEGEYLETWLMHEVNRDGFILVALRPNGTKWYVDIRNYEKVKVI